MFTARALSVGHAAVSRTGNRERNEDSLIALKRDGRYCFVVADGLGAHGRGDEASKLLTDAFAREFMETSNNRPFIERAFARAAQEIAAAQHEKRALNQMRTTAVVLSITGNKYLYAHIGDSRLYQFKRGTLASRTLDHSVPQMLAQTGDIKPADIASHPDRGRLLRALGDGCDKVRYEISKEQTLRHNTAFLLCTDGFWEFLPEGKFAPSPGVDADGWLSSLLAEVERTEKDMDNYSAIAVVVS
jgi:serine/threonine protein phosphatase PrpC